MRTLTAPARGAPAIAAARPVYSRPSKAGEANASDSEAPTAEELRLAEILTDVMAHKPDPSAKSARSRVTAAQPAVATIDTGATAAIEPPPLPVASLPDSGASDDDAAVASGRLAWVLAAKRDRHLDRSTSKRAWALSMAIGSLVIVVAAVLMSGSQIHLGG